MLVVLVIVVVTALTAVADAEAAPRVGRWIGTSDDGMRVSFMIQRRPGGRRYIAGAVASCERNGAAHALAELVDRHSPAWPVDRRGRISRRRDPRSESIDDRSPLQGRLGERRTR